MSTDIVVSFDTTGSMSPCIAEVRRRVKAAVSDLFHSIPDLRIGIIAHGDYCDQPHDMYLLDLTDNQNLIETFIVNAPNTNGGDSDEYYEYVLRVVNKMSWEADNRSLIMIADALPHEPSSKYYYMGANTIDWREEANRLADKRVSIYSVEALGNRNAWFYQDLADRTNGRFLFLSQFADAVETITAISYHSAGDVAGLQAYGNKLESEFKMNRGLALTFNRLGTITSTIKEDASGLIPVDRFRFQVLHVDNFCDIKSFVQSTGATFRKGRGFYQFTKPETIQEFKEVILRNKVSGDMFTGAEARNFIGLPFGDRGTIRPKYFDDYEVYVQSTSVNRKLIPNTKFLYENSI